MSDENNAVRIQGTLLGHPVDVTVTECVIPEVEDVPDAPEAPEAPEVTPEDRSEELEARAAEEKQEPQEPVSEVSVEASAEGEVVKPADPAPAPAESTDEPKNPAGNSEQL